MGLTYLSIDDLPADGAIVWCRWPYILKPGQQSVSRPVLVRQTSVHRDPNGVEYGAVTVTYGTGELGQADPQRDLIVQDRAEWEALGLHKATAFLLDPARKKTIVWSHERFLAPDRVRGTPLVLGQLDLAQRARLAELLTKRGL